MHDALALKPQFTQVNLQSDERLARERIETGCAHNHRGRIEPPGKKPLNAWALNQAMIDKEAAQSMQLHRKIVRHANIKNPPFQSFQFRDDGFPFTPLGHQTAKERIHELDEYFYH